MVSNPCRRLAPESAAQLRAGQVQRELLLLSGALAAKVKHMAPFLGLFACIMLFILFTFVLLFTGLDFSGS